MQSDRVLSYLGLATRAGKTKSGEFSVEKSVKEGQAHLVLVSTLASENTKKKFRNLCSYRNVPLHYYGSGEELGKACGKDFRISVAVEDQGLSDAILSCLGVKKDVK